MIRNLFFSLSVRERLLLTVFVWALIMVWLLGLLDSFGNTLRDFRYNGQALERFEETLEQSEMVELLLEEARAGLDSSRTYSASQLVGRLDSLAREADLGSFDLNIPSTQETDLFSFHNVRLNINNTRIEELIAFDQRIKEDAPYISLARFELVASRRDPRYLDAVFELTSFELKEDALND